MNQNELYHHGVKGQKWGVRRYQNYDGTSITKGRKRYSDEERKRNGQELNEVIERSRSHRDTGNPSAKEVWETSSTMKKFLKNTKKDYKKRNDIYSYNKNVPKYIREKYRYVFDSDDIIYYGYGKHFADLMKKKASDLVYDEKDVQKIMQLVKNADLNDYNNGTYHERAWLYWH